MTLTNIPEKPESSSNGLSSGSLITILFGFIERDRIKKVMRSCDSLLAFDLPAMQSCRFANILFMRPDDFFSREEYKTSLDRNIRDLLGIFSHIDKKYAEEIPFSKAFAAGTYPICYHLSNLHYLTALAREINGRFLDKRFIIVSNTEYSLDGPISLMNCNIFQNQLSNHDNAEIYNLKVLKKLLEPSEIIYCPESKSDILEKNHFVKSFMNYAYLLKLKNIDLLLEKMKRRFERKENIQSKNKIIFCIQRGFEVDLLRKYMPEYSFINPLLSLRESKLDIERSNTGKHYGEAAVYMSRKYPEWKQEINRFFDDYHKGIVCTIVSVSNIISKQIDQQKPKCALYSIGAINPIESIYEWMLNKNNVPIFSFQHGGGSFYFREIGKNHPWYTIEESNGAKKTLFLCSKLEAKLRKEDEFFSTKVAGSIKHFEWHESKERRKIQKKNGRVIYIQGRCPNDHWKTLNFSEEESIIFSKHQLFFAYASKYELEVDVKLFPGTMDIYRPYFRRMMQQHRVKGKILSSVNAERIASEYSLVIVEYIGSALNTFFMVLDRPVIYYLFDQELITKAVRKDIYQRHYVASNSDEIETLLRKFKESGLQSKLSEQFIDKYVFPLDQGNPGHNMAEIIKSQISVGIAPK